MSGKLEIDVIKMMNDALDGSCHDVYASWGDAPVQTFAAALFLKRDEVHFMQDFGYSYSVGLQCPADSLVGAELQCICDPTDSFREYIHIAP